MSKSDTLEQQLLEAIFKDPSFTALGSITLGANLYLALHTADPGDAGTQATSEIVYTGYARAAVARGAGFTRTGSSVSPAADVVFPGSTSGGVTATHFSVGIASSGATAILYSGALSPTIAIVNGVSPVIDSATTIAED